MKNLSDKLYDGFIGTKLAFCFVLLSVYLVGLQLAGSSFLLFLYFALACVLLVLLPGYCIYRLLRLECIITDFALPFSFLLGVVALVFVFFVDSSLGLQRFGVISLLIASGYSIKLIISEKKHRSAKFTPQNTFLLSVVCALMFVVTFATVMKNAHPSAVGQNMLSQDLMWHVGNANSFLLSFVPSDLRVVGVDLLYHFLNELFSASLSYFTAIPVFDIMAMFGQALFIPMLVISLFSLGKIVYGEVFRANIFLLSPFFFTCLSLGAVLYTGGSLFTVSLIQALITNINAMSLALCFLCVFTALLFRLFDLQKGRTIAIVLLMLSFLAVIFSKSPIAAIIALGLVATSIARLIQRKLKPIELLCTALIGALFLFLFINLFSFGANSSTTFSHIETISFGVFGNLLADNLTLDTVTTIQSLKIFALMSVQLFCISPFTVSVFSVSTIKSILGFKRLDFFNLFCFAVGIGGVVAFFFTSHPSSSQVYFLYIALFFIHLIAIRDFDFKKKNAITVVGYCILGISLITTVFLYVNLVGSGFRQFLYHYDIIEKYDYANISKSEDELAGEFLKENMEKDELFLTNRIDDSSPQLSGVYTCFSGRQAYLEGYKYTVSNMGGTDDFPDVFAMHANVEMIFSADTDIETIKSFAQQHNIKYIVYSSQAVGDTAQFDNLEKVFEDGSVTIYDSGI